MRIICISGWLAVPINPDKWSSTVLSVASVVYCGAGGHHRSLYNDVVRSFFLKLIYYTDSRYKVYKDKLQNCSCNQFHCIADVWLTVHRNSVWIGKTN